MGRASSRRLDCINQVARDFVSEHQIRLFWNLRPSFAASTLVRTPHCTPVCIVLVPRGAICANDRYTDLIESSSGRPWPTQLCACADDASSFSQVLQAYSRRLQVTSARLGPRDLFFNTWTATRSPAPSRRHAREFFPALRVRCTYSYVPFPTCLLRRGQPGTSRIR